MYLPRSFAETDLASLDALFTHDPFVTLISNDAEGSPFVSPLPVLYQRDDERVLIEGHWARPNPQSRHAGAVVMIVHGPHAYVSPSWYPDKEAAARVPTWNYATAHLHGALGLFDDAVSLADLVSRLTDHFETSVGSDWRFDPQREELCLQLRGIVGFRFRPSKIDLKFKLNQNHPPATVRAGVEVLSQQHDGDAWAIAAMMRNRLKTL
ncbi:MAG: FMN-binding negative transcriptional regulator [Lysobacter sp.]|nr:FMN-binding negative transcriptional regulator [Lysobacter sp.]